MPEITASIVGGGREKFPSLEAALASDKKISFLRWKGQLELCALDVDMLVGKRFTIQDLERFCQTAGPLPDLAWITKSGGLRLIFTADPEGAGYELSALDRAALFCGVEPGAITADLVEGVELLNNTRPPRGRVLRPGGGYGVTNLPGRLKGMGGNDTATPEEVAAWLAKNGMVMGQRYAHDRCPIAPNSSGSNSPVQVTEWGIRCYRCKGVLGTGGRSWASLIGNKGETQEPPLAALASNWVNWSHANLTIQALRPTLNLAGRKALYSALLNVVHHEQLIDDTTRDQTEENIRWVWRSDIRVVRGLSGWLHAGSLTPHEKFGVETLKAMVWGRRSGPARELAMTAEPLPGYIPVDPRLHLLDKPTIENGILLVPKALATAKPDRVLTQDEAIDLLMDLMPGVSREWMRMMVLTVRMKLLSEMSPPTPPMLILTGPSGAGKGAMIQMAAAIAGCRSSELRADGAREFAMSIGEGLEHGAGFLCLDEAGKAKAWWEHSGPLLRLGETHTWRKLHFGSVETPVRAGVVIMGSTLPAGLTTMGEFARRAVVYECPRIDPEQSAQWGELLQEELGVAQFSRLRTTPIGAAIAEAILRPAIEEFKAMPYAPNWVAYATERGAEPLRDDEEAMELAELIADCYHYFTTGSEAMIELEGKRNNGWLRCYFKGSPDSAENAPATLLSEWFGPECRLGERMGRISRIHTADVVAICKLPPDISMQMKVVVRGGKTWVRFVSSENRRSLERKDRSIYPAPILTIPERAVSA